MKEMKTNYIFIICIFIAFTSCATGPPSQKELASADYGTSITQDEAQRKAKDFFFDNLKDPSSAQYEWGTVYQGWIRHAIIHGSGLVFGYILDVRVNAKNSYGGYTGYKQYKFVFHNGEMETVYGEKTSDGTTVMGKIY